MFEVSQSLLSWRHELDQTGALSVDEIIELESHLLQDMESLHAAGLQPDEAFLIATRRLGRSAELATEFAKNDSPLSWRRPVKLLLWGLATFGLSLVMSFALLLMLCSFGLAGRLASLWSEVIVLVEGGAYAATFTLLCGLVLRPAGWFARALARLEIALQSHRGAAWLLTAAALTGVAQFAVLLLLKKYLDPIAPQLVSLGGHAGTQLYSSSILWQSLFPLIFAPCLIVGLLIAVVQTERRWPTGQPASPTGHQLATHGSQK